MRTDLKKPCGECPFRVDSAKGWLGPWDGEELMQAIPYNPFPCHKTINGNVSFTDEMQSCAGAAIFMLNKCQLPYDEDMAEHKEKMREELNVAELKAGVFKNNQEFIEYHDRTS